MLSRRIPVLIGALILSLGLVTVALAAASSTQGAPAPTLEVFAAQQASRPAGDLFADETPPPTPPTGGRPTPKKGTNPYGRALQERKEPGVPNLTDALPGAPAASTIYTFTSSPAITITDDAYIGILDGNDGFGVDAGMVCDVIYTWAAIPPTQIISDVQVQLAINHTWIGDLVIKLQSPQGSILGMMSRPGYAESADDGNGCCGDASDLVDTSPVTFYDAAPFDAEAMGTGNVVCQDDGECDFFPNPDSVSGLTNFAGFSGESATGIWGLCVGDSAAGDEGSLESWTLTLTMAPVSDLSTSYKEAPAVVFEGDPISYTIVLQNTGNTTLTNAVLTDVIPLGTTYVPGSLSCSSGACAYDPGANAVTWNGDIDPMASNTQVLETFTNTWDTSTLGMVFDAGRNLVRYAHESHPNPTIYDVDASPPHNLLGSIQLSAVNPGWPITLDDRDGAAYDSWSDTYFLPDYNGDLSIRDDNIVEIDPTGLILNAWETDGPSNDSYDGSFINQIIDLAAAPGPPFTRFFATAAGDGGVVYEINLDKAGQFITDTWGTIVTWPVPGLGDNSGIDFDADHGWLYHSDFASDVIVATDLSGNLVHTFVCPNPVSGIHTGITYIEGSNPPEVWVTDFISNQTTRCTTGASKVTVSFAVDPFIQGVVTNTALLAAPVLTTPLQLEASTLVTTDCNTPDNPFVNCSFETGDFTGWITSDLARPFFPLQVNGRAISSWPGFFFSDPTHGDFAALHGFDGITGTIELAQDVVLPPGAHTVEFDYRAAWDLVTFMPPDGQDRTFEVVIEPFGGGPPLQTLNVLTAYTGTLVTDTGNSRGVVDVSPFADSAVRVKFRWVIPNNFTGPAFFQFDNVMLRADNPAIAVDPASLASTQVAGQQITHTLTISNVGGGDLSWDLFEVDATTLAHFPQASPDARLQTPFVPAGTPPSGPAPPVPLSLVSPESPAPAAPLKPTNPDAVLWDQPVSITNTNAYADQDFEPAFDTYDIFIADDFTNTDPWVLSTIFVPGNTWNTGGDLTCATAFHWQIYADAGGVPAGDPWGGGSPPVWNLALPPGDPAVNLSTGVGGWLTNVTLDLPFPLFLPPGTWWLVFYPQMDFTTCFQYGRHVSDTTNGNPAQVINPAGGFGFPSTWTSVQDPSTWALSTQDFAFRLEGLVAQDIPWVSENPVSGVTTPGSASAVDVIFDSTGLAIGTYTGTLYIANNDPNNNLTSVPLTLTVIPGADLALTKMDSPDPVVPGGLLAYTLTVSNNGPDQATGVVLTDNLPAGVSFVSASPGCAEAGGVVTCNLGAIANGAVAVVTIQVTAPVNPTVLTNQASVTSALTDPDPSNNTASEDTTVTLYHVYLPRILRP